MTAGDNLYLLANEQQSNPDVSRIAQMCEKTVTVYGTLFHACLLFHGLDESGA